MVGVRRSGVDSAPPAPSLNAARLVIARHAVQADPDHVERLTERVARDAAGAMAGLTDQIRAAFDSATDLRDLADRLAALDLDPAALAEAMTRGMALAHLAGQAALLDEIEGE